MDLSELRDSARSKADEQEADFIDNVELDRFINQGARLVHGKMVQHFNDDFVTVGTLANGGLFTTTNGVQAYALPATLKKLVKVETRSNGSRNDNDWRKLSRVNIANDHNDYRWPAREGYAPEFGYFPTKDAIYLRPVPAAIFQVRLWFVPKFVKLVLDDDTPDLPEEFHDLISEFASIQCLRKSGEGIYKEAMDLFNVELNNFIETVDFHTQEPEQMVITDDGWGY